MESAQITVTAPDPGAGSVMGGHRSTSRSETVTTPVGETSPVGRRRDGHAEYLIEDAVDLSRG